jgi:hypothetical protein
MSNQDPDILVQKKKMQLEILLKDSDLKKSMRLKTEIEIALRDLKHKEGLLQAEIIAKEVQLKKFEGENLILQNEIIKLKHKINGLSHD